MLSLPLAQLLLLGSLHAFAPLDSALTFSVSRSTRRSLNEEERALSNMLALADVDDDGTPSQVKDISQFFESGEEDDDGGEFINIRRTQLQDLLNERETLYAEILRYKDENTNLFRDLGSAEDLCDELQDKIESLEEGKKDGEDA